MTRIAIAAVLSGLLVGCLGGGGGKGPNRGGTRTTSATEGGHGTPTNPNPPAPPPNPPSDPGSTSDEPVIPNSSGTPFGVTLYVGFKENVTLADMQELEPTLNEISDYYWNVSRGQTYIHAVKFFDNIAGDGNINNPWGLPEGIDVWLKPWNDEPGGVAGYVYYASGVGRVNRIVVMPPYASQGTWLHELGHFFFRLSWSVSPGLGDEYSMAGDPGWSTEACIMNSTFSPLRFCNDDNHINREEMGDQSCWGQILDDYPNWTYPPSWTDSSAPADISFEYTDS